MKPGLALGTVMAFLAVAFAPAQNLGLGTGSRAPDDSAAVDSRDRGEEAPAPRKSQLNRRLGLTARRGKDFDPKVFEARGRELTGQFYEIGSPAPKQKNSPVSAGNPSDPMASQPKNGGRQWLFWVGVAGVAGASAGAVGYLLMDQAHPASAPPAQDLIITDDP
jgi:hypothetical protein